MYGGLSVTFFFLVLFLQQVAGYDALQAGLALMPSTLVMFALSKRVGRLADRLGPAPLHGLRPADRRAGPRRSCCASTRTSTTSPISCRRC